MTQSIFLLGIKQEKSFKQMKQFLLNLSNLMLNYVPHQRGGGHIVFGADPVGVGVRFGVTLYCLHDVS